MLPLLFVTIDILPVIAMFLKSTPTPVHGTKKAAKQVKQTVIRSVIVTMLIIIGGFFAASQIAAAPTANPTQPSPAATPALTSIPLPCRESIESLPLASANPAPYLAAIACLRSQDPIVLLHPTFALTHPIKVDSILKARLPDNPNWFLTHLDRFRVRRDTANAKDMIYLSELKFPNDASIYLELAEVYQIFPDPFHSGLAYLRNTELDSAQVGFVQYKLDNLLRTSATDLTPTQLLDSLTAGFTHHHVRTAEVLETLCWNNRDYACAYQNFTSSFALKNPGPAATLERANRFLSLGYFDHAALIMDKLAWHSLPSSWRPKARVLYLQIRFQLKDWSAIATESSVAAPSPALSEEETYIISTALLNLGKANQALSMLKRLEEKSTPAPWGFRGRLLKAQALMSLGKPKDASETLTALKRDPHRQEGTGPILFWQGCIAADLGAFSRAESLMVLASAYTGGEEAQRAIEYRFFLLQDTGVDRPHFFRGLPESPRPAAERLQSLGRVDHGSGLWPFAQLEKAQILVQLGRSDSAEAILDDAAHHSPDRIAGLQAEAKAAFLLEKLPGGRQAALVRYEDLLIRYQQGVIPEFSRGRIKALK